MNDLAGRSRLERFLGYRLSRAKVRVHRCFMQRVAPFALSPGEFSVLVLLDENPGAFLRDLSRALDISAPNLVSVVDRLVRRGLLSRTPDPKDRRLQHLDLTAAGQALLARAESEVEDFEQRLAGMLTTEEHRIFLTALERISAQADEA